MGQDKIELYVHFIWTTWDREPWISPQLELDLFPVIVALGERHGAKTLALKGVADHVHWLVKFSSTTRTCDLVKDAKGASSQWMSERLDGFKWRATYAAFSVSRWNVRQIIVYIEAQKEHHAQNTTRTELESDERRLRRLHRMFGSQSCGTKTKGSSTRIEYSIPLRWVN